MNKIKIILVSILFSILVTGCQTVQQKTDAIVKKENEKLSKFIGKSSSELQIQLGKPDEDFKNAEGNLELIYNTKKYLIPCERRFEINSENVVIGLYLMDVFKAYLRGHASQVRYYLFNFYKSFFLMIW